MERGINLHQIALTHYAHHKTIQGYFSQPRTTEEASQAISTALKRGWRVCPMGAQNSFSDVFLGEGQLHISALNMNRVLGFNETTGEITIEPGVRIWQVLQILMPSGFYLPGVSGSYTDTIAGMISSNSHGKDSWKHGNCGNNVAELKLLTADGEVRTVEKGTPLMNAVIGGLGMLGLIVQITLQPQKLPSYFVQCQDYIIPSKNIVEFTTPADFKYIWLDMANPRKPLSVVKVATFDTSRQHEPVHVPSAKPTVWGLPSPVFWKTLRLFWNRHTYEVCNAALRGVHRIRTNEYPSNVVNYYYPWRKYPDNCKLFSNDAFHEMQILFPYEKFQDALERVSALTRQYEIYPLNVNVKWHREEDFYLSFSGKGLCLLTTFETALVSTSNGLQFREAFMKIVEEMQGKTYLSKYAYLTAKQLRNQYPKFKNWMEVKKQLDPRNIFLSDRCYELLG